MKSKCMDIVTALTAEDQDALLSRLDHYKSLGVPAEQAQVMAAKDVLEEVKADRDDFMKKTEEQHPGEPEDEAIDQTETPEFKKWSEGLSFHRSFDEAGSDRGVFKLYHATPKDFSEFKPGGNDPLASGRAIWMSTDPSATSAAFRVGYESGGFRDGANIMPVFAKMKSPLVLDTRGTLDWARSVYADGEFPQLISDKTIDMLKEDGYDSIIYKHDDIFGKKAASQNEAIVFDQTQIKSAIGNNGKFDGTNPDIRFSARPQTDTKEFKSWFGDSKVVDDSGAPLVMYTGTSKDVDFTKFKVPKNGAWFTSDPKSASDYAISNDSMDIKTDDYRTFTHVNTASRVMPAYLQISNPYKLNEEEDKRLKYAKNYKREQGIVFDGVRARGFDGIDFGDGIWVVLGGPTQIKSAIGNNGEFSQRNPDIRYSERSLTDTPEFKKWFGGSKAVDANGKPIVMYHGTRPGNDIAAFDKPSDGDGIYFTPDPSYAEAFTEDLFGDGLSKGAIYPVYLSMQNPFIVRSNDFDSDEVQNFLYRGLDTKELEKSGHDSAMLYIEDELDQVMVFSPSQIKSAVGNGGGFDAGSDDILYSERAPYSSAPDSLMGFKNLGPQKPFHDSNYKHVEFVRVAWPDGGSMVDAMKGLNKPHALERARRNWKDAEISSITPEEAERQDPGIVAATQLPQFSMRNGAPTWEMYEGSKFDNMVYTMQNKMIDVKRVIESITKFAGSVADDINVYLQEELFHGRSAKRTHDFAHDELEPLMKEIRSSGYQLSDVEEYLHARHAKEANAVIADRNQGNPDMQDGGSGMTNQAADDYMQALSSDDKQKLDALAAKVDAIIGKTRQLYADYGLESQATVDGWNGMFQHYIPLMREDKEGSMGIGQGFSVKGKETRGRTGSKRKVVDILANVAMQRERLIVRGEKNRVAKSLVGLARANPNQDFWDVGSPPAERVYDPKTNSVVERVDPLFKSRENVMVAKLVKPNGEVEEVAVVFNEDNERAVRMAKALKNLDAGDLEGLLGVSAKITRYFSAVNTQYNPVFGVVNLVRDVQSAMLNLDTTPLAKKKGRIARDTISALSGIYQDMRAARNGQPPNSPWANLWEEFQRHGGQTGYRQMFATSADRANELKAVLNPDAWLEGKYSEFFTANGALKVPLSKAKQGAEALFGWLSDYNESMENGVRLAAYKAGLDQGMSKMEAASLAKNLTVNFNRKGQIGQQAGAVYAFFNAAMQGTARIGQTLFTMEGGDVKTLRLSSTGKKIVYGGMLLGTMQALALAAAGFGDDDPPEFVRSRSLIIPTGGKTYMTIPMPQGFNVLPGLGRNLTEFALGGFKSPAKRAIGIFSMFADNFNPIGNAGLSMQTLAPTALDPLVALTENRDFTGKPIARVSSNKAIPGFTQYKDSATVFGKLVAEAINGVTGGNAYVAGALSPTPDQIDYLLGQVTGGVGRELSKVEQSALTVARGEDTPIHKIPLVGRFYGNAASQASQGGQFYANVNALNELETELKGMRKDGKLVEANELQRSRPDAYLIAQANVAERQVQRLRKEKRDLVANGADRTTVAAKETQITEVMTRLNQSMERLQALEKQAN